MLSILIPTFNHCVVNLVNELHKQCNENDIIFEILILDDSSTDKEISFNNMNLNSLFNVSYRLIKNNIGRSAIRNKLCQLSKYKWLLFLDADVKINSKKFLRNYLDSIEDNCKVIYGGISYSEKNPRNEQTLRWKYGKKRESKSLNSRTKTPYLSLLSSNFLIQKKIIAKTPFNEKVSKKANEDSLFSFDLKSKKIHITHIDNPVIHENLENSSIFLEKTLEFVKASLFFTQSNLIDKNYMKITRTYFTLKKLKLVSIFKYVYVYFGNAFKNQLTSKKPSLFIFDLYRLSYICYISKD
tara:strand:- start:3730 stop:4623 length:894 start_codon:yes stop_codon:yes gene_type:complete